jgi:hypothetical protein
MIESGAREPRGQNDLARHEGLTGLCGGAGLEKLALANSVKILFTFYAAVP